MDTLLRDMRYAVRGLLRKPAFAAGSVLTLALGIGANTVVFSFLQALILRPLPIAEPESVFFIQPSNTFTHPFPNYRVGIRDCQRTDTIPLWRDGDRRGLLCACSDRSSDGRSSCGVRPRSAGNACRSSDRVAGGVIA